MCSDISKEIAIIGDASNNTDRCGHFPTLFGEQSSGSHGQVTAVAFSDVKLSRSIAHAAASALWAGYLTLMCCLCSTILLLFLPSWLLAAPITLFAIYKFAGPSAREVWKAVRAWNAIRLRSGVVMDAIGIGVRTSRRGYALYWDDIIACRLDLPDARLRLQTRSGKSFPVDLLGCSDRARVSLVTTILDRAKLQAVPYERQKQKEESRVFDYERL